jgi:hypothetical protein
MLSPINRAGNQKARESQKEDSPSDCAKMVKEMPLDIGMRVGTRLPLSV